MRCRLRSRAVVQRLLPCALTALVACDGGPARRPGADGTARDLRLGDAARGDGAPPPDGSPAPPADGGDARAIDGEVPALPFLAGVNLAGAEFGEGALPGEHGKDYIYPSPAEVDYFTTAGMNALRLPFRWERLQPQPRGELDAEELGRIELLTAHATARGAHVVLDPHNYARYHGAVIGAGGSSVSAADFADFWRRLAQRFKGNPKLIFGLMNEPHDMPSELWRDDANAAIQAIRDAGAANLILVPGNGWTGAHSWEQSYYGTPNSVVMQQIVDPLNNYAFEVHQYLDADSSGTSASCVSEQIGAERLASFTAWLAQQGARGFLGELGAADNATCLAALDAMLGHLDANRAVWIGWTYWAAGPWWGDYMFSVEPQGGQDKPQMAILTKHL